MVGMGPAWALATEVGTLGQGDRGETALPYLFAFLLFLSGGRGPTRPLPREAVLRGRGGAWMWSAAHRPMLAIRRGCPPSFCDRSLRFSSAPVVLGDLPSGLPVSAFGGGDLRDSGQ